MFDRRLILNFDIFLLVAVLLLSFLGVVNLKSISSSSSGASLFYFYKQISWIMVGLFFLFIIVNINYVSIVRYSYYLHICSVVLLIIVLFYGKSRLGSQRWLYIGGFSLQPSEIAKITFILALSKFYSENVSQRPYHVRDMFYPFVILIITFLPIYFQPDLGTSGILFLTFISMIFFLNINRKSVCSFFCLFVFLLPCFWFMLKDYQKTRILVFLNPELDPLNAGYQVIQSKIAIGSGGLLGKGFKLGTQNQLRFLPEQHTDFVFSVWAEEWGFVGCFFLLSLFFFLIYRGLSIAYNCKNLYGSFLAAGISLLFFWQFIINVFMTLGLFPVAGVTFPFFSYGGSSMVSCLVAIGLVLNINMRKFK
jgi:rod shape determining protein RodA